MKNFFTILAILAIFLYSCSIPICEEGRVEEHEAGILFGPYDNYINEVDHQTYYVYDVVDAKGNVIKTLYLSSPDQAGEDIEFCSCSELKDGGKNER